MNIPKKKTRRQFGSLVFDMGSVSAGSSASVSLRNNREIGFVVRELGAACMGGANSHGDWTVQVRDQASGYEWFNSAAQLSALVGAMVNTGILSADNGSAPQRPYVLPCPYVVEPGNQLQVTVYNNGTNAVSLTLVLSGFYGEDQ